jgi:hypothetical protein
MMTWVSVCSIKRTTKLDLLLEKLKTGRCLHEVIKGVRLLWIYSRNR